MAIPIINSWENYFRHRDEGMGSTYERVILNDILLEIVKRYEVQTVLESPSFGFTGLSGINLMELARQGLEITLEDHDPQRLEMVKELWSEAGLSLQSNLNQGYRTLDYPDNSFDMSFSFSALWFCQDLSAYLKELCRVSSRCAFISVPNREGLGYKSQLADYSPEAYPDLKPAHIDPPSVIRLMNANGWMLVKSSLFDCPPWPDIGMSKEDFLERKLGIKLPKKAFASSPKQPLCILDHYRGLDADLPQRMRKLSLVERYAPEAFKRVWAHHRYLLFVPWRDGVRQPD